MARKVQYMLSQSYNLGYDDGYADAKQNIINKSCDWWINYLDYPTNTQEDRDRIKEMVDEFRKAIKQ